MIPVVDGPVGVSVSGGAHSALLLYFLMKQHKHKIHIFTLADKSKFYRNAKQCLHVVDWCRTRCNFNNFEHHIIHSNQQNAEELLDLPRKYCEDNSIIKFYRGETANPPKQVTDEFKHQQGPVEQERRNPLITREIQPDDTIIFPFTNLDKRAIAQIYRDENLQELYALTISCESLIDLGPIHCDDCWWCEERKWGFGNYVTFS